MLGILAVNIAGFAGPAGSTVTPHALMAASPADEAAFAAVFLLFEGKMRALFTILFGASLALYVARADAAGRSGQLLQIRRLGWLLAFGLAHYYLLWWGDILFLYAVAGIVALLMLELPTRTLVATALIVYLGWHVPATVAELPAVQIEERVRLGTASKAEAEEHNATVRRFRSETRREAGQQRAGFIEQIEGKLRNDPWRPFRSSLVNIGETVPLILFGIVLFRTGFFAGQWPPARLGRIAGASFVVGGAMTLAALAWLLPRHFPVQAMHAAILVGMAIPHILMAFAYAAWLMLAAERIGGTRIGRGLIAAGRMAFTNYIATSVVMTGIFGWGLHLAGTMASAQQLAFVLVGWTLMLAWSAPWLARFRHGPLEWLWRSLTEGRNLPLRR